MMKQKRCGVQRRYKVADRAMLAGVPCDSGILGMMEWRRGGGVGCVVSMCLVWSCAVRPL